jgi:GntR family transcriptional regulator/MocR family aminotransferase
MLIPLKLVRDQPLQQQLYDQLRTLVLSGRLVNGSRMPSSRMLADRFCVSRITVVLTYERLIAEGFLTTVPATGTFVSGTAPTPPAAPAARVAGATSGAPASVGRPDARLFPASRWRGLIRDALDSLNADFVTDHPDGDPALRRAIAGWLSTSRRLSVEPDQIILASGRQHALHIAAHMLLHCGARAVIESPGDARAAALIASTGAMLMRIPVDESGMRTDLLPFGPAAMAVVTPGHQRLLGVAMTASRCDALLRWAERAGAVVVADEFDGELRYEDTDSPPLMGLDRLGRVIHLGGFGLSLGPCLQLAYLVMPRRLVAQAQAASRLISEPAGPLESAALGHMLESGAYARHVHHLRKVYLGRREALLGSLRRQFGADIRIGPHGSGLHVVWHVPRHLTPAGAVAAQARQLGLDAAADGERALLLGFGVPAENHIALAVVRLADALAGAHAPARRVMSGA